MNDLLTVRGFEDLWRPPVAGRRIEARAEISRARRGEAKARLARIVRRAPEVMVKITGKTRGGAHLKAHLAYISRDGALTLEGSDGERLKGIGEVNELARDWAGDDFKKRRDASLTTSLMLSMPAGTDAAMVRDAARQFALETFGGKFEYAFALHTDVDHPHVHMAVRSLGEGGQRLNPRKADLERWRQTFARTLRDRGVEAEATPRRSRGIIRKPEKMPVRRLRERSERQEGGLAGSHHAPPRVLVAAAAEARDLVEGRTAPQRPWEARILERQRFIRGRYIEAARVLGMSGSQQDQALARDILEFVKRMPSLATRRHELAGAARDRSSEEADRGARNGAEKPSTGRTR